MRLNIWPVSVILEAVDDEQSPNRMKDHQKNKHCSRRSIYEELEEVLVMADLGIHTTENIIEELKRKVKEQHIKEPQACKQLLADTIKEQMRVDEEAYQFEQQTSVVLVIGVNGVGKTTTIGKLAGQYKKAGKKVVLAAADTFRAAAIEQLTEWANRTGCDIIAQSEGSDPAAVIFDSIAAAKARNADVLLRYGRTSAQQEKSDGRTS